MKIIISSVTGVHDKSSETSDIIVFPEGTDREVLKQTSKRYSDSLIVGAYVQNKCFEKKCYGALYYAGKEVLRYHKVGVCGICNDCSGSLTQKLPIYELENICLGILVCMDVDQNIATQVISRIKQSLCVYKILCIPAMMGLGGWSPESISRSSKFGGINVAFSNNAEGEYYGNQVIDSFITDSHNNILIRMNRGPFSAKI